MSSNVVTTSYCYICHQETDSPRSKIWLSELNERISLCTDLCLSKYFDMEKQFQKARSLSKIVEPKSVKSVKYVQKPKIEDDVLILDL
jgi:hypothetical protein